MSEPTQHNWSRLLVTRSRVTALLCVATLALGLTWAARARAGGLAGDDPAPGVGARWAARAAASPADAAVSVGGMAVTRGTLVVSIKAAGQAEAGRRMSLASLVRGRIQNVAVQESEPVRAGQAVVLVDPSEHELSLRDAEANTRDAEARYQDLLISDEQIADPVVRTQRERLARVKSGLESATVRLTRTRTELERTRVTTPFGGRVASLRVVPGQWIEAGQELMTLVDLRPARVEVQVLESEIQNVERGSRAHVTFAAFPGEVFAGRVEMVNPLVDSGTRSARVTVSIPNADERILPGMYARVAIESKRFADRLLVPRTAILRRDGRTLLFTDDHGRAKWHYVRTGVQNDTLVEVLPDPGTEPPRVGDVVLTRGHQMLVHDAPIRVVPGPEAAGIPANR
ncbi:MAG TPA: efflux RND transporter periplasmic adaptor subunit [Longimicrobium sp.]|jgi:HlyD family secretion protein